MAASAVTFILGVMCIVIGIVNRKGNISSVHTYHRHRVTEEDRIPFGKKVGLGTILCGCGILAFSVLSAITALTEQQIYILIGVGLLFAGLIAGLIVSFHAMIKYNKGIF